jgi:xeroderma pigmentosum group C-complementing protein
VKKKRRESEDDFSPKVKVKRRVQVKPETEDEKLRKKQGVDVWAEVFLENEEKWISVDVFKAQVHCVNELHVSR